MAKENTSIVIAGKKFDAGCRVILWNEEAGLSFYPKGKGYTAYNQNFKQVQQRIKALYIHHTVTFRAHSTFGGLQGRGLSCVFLIDDDINEDTGCATIYQCLDVKEGAYTQGGRHNHDGAGIEICYYPDAWTQPPRYSAYNRKRFGVPDHEIKSDVVHGHKFSKCYGPTEAQVKACQHLACAYLKAFPHIQPEFPRDENGELITTVVPLERRHGLLHHYHIKRSKIDAMGFPTDQFEADVKAMLENEKPLTGKTFWDRLKGWVTNERN
ncbi:MAG: N-acetylmuramoyl-L-alanine amidase [Candidatus Hermodarchaeia archaeon]